MAESTQEKKKAGRPNKAEVENKKLQKQIEEMQKQMQAILKAQQESEKNADKIKEELEKTISLKEEKETELKELQEDFKVRRKGRVKIPNDLEIVVKSNVDGGFTFSNTKGRVNVYIKLNDTFDEDILTYEELRAFNNATNSNWLRNGQIAIVDVEDDEITVDDVIKGLRLEKIYNNEKSVAPSEIAEIFTDKVDAKRFDEILLNSPHLSEAIIQVGLVMKKNGVFNDNAKISLLKQRSRNPILFN